MSLTVSVAMCTYNGARFVDEQLRSIIDQTVRPSEVIVADDGSRDGTLDRVRDTLGCTDIPVTILPGTHPLGVTRNFQRAIEHSTGALIALSDQDDVWHPNRLATAIPAFEADAGLLLQHSDARLVNENGEALGVSLLEALRMSTVERDLIASGRGFEAYLRRNLVTGATVVFRRELLAAALPFPEQWVHDEWLAMIAAALGGANLVPTELVDYRQHGGNEIGVRKPTLRYRLQRMLQQRGNRYEELAIRSKVLLDRLQSLDVEPRRVELAADKAHFEAVRATYPTGRFARLPAVTKEYRAGSYRELSSQGNLDVVRDLVQPA